MEPAIFTNIILISSIDCSLINKDIIDCGLDIVEPVTYENITNSVICQLLQNISILSITPYY